MIIAKVSEKKNREKPKAGNVQAVCTAVRDIGLQRSKQGKVSHKIVIMWELNQKITQGEFAGKRMVQSSQFTLSMYENAMLRKTIESWFAKKFKDEETACQFDLEKLIGKNCLLNLTENGEYINVSGVTPLIDGMEKMIPELAPDHIYKWIDDLRAKAIPEQETDELPEEHEDEGDRKPSDIFTAE